MNYIVPGVKLIAQDQKMSCWYASGQMLIQWRRESRRMTERAHPAPEQVARWQQLYRDNTGMTNVQISNFAHDLGLRQVPPLSPTAEAIKDWLQAYGPLWVNGAAHITVIAGIRDTEGKVEVLVYDPLRPDKRNGEWRDFGAWYYRDPFSGRDTSKGVPAVFLYAPAA